MQRGATQVHEVYTRNKEKRKKKTKTKMKKKKKKTIKVQQRINESSSNLGTPESLWQKM